MWRVVIHAIDVGGARRAGASERECVIVYLGGADFELAVVRHPGGQGVEREIDREAGDHVASTKA